MTPAANASPTGGEGGPGSRLGLLLATFAFATALAAPFLPWWVLTITPPGAASNFGLSEACAGTFCAGYPPGSPVAAVFETARILARIGALLGGLAEALQILAVRRPAISRWALLVTGTAPAPLLLAAAYLFLGLPGTVGDPPGGQLYVSSFFGTWQSESDGTLTTYAFGGGVGWYLAILSASLYAVAAVVYLRYGAKSSAIARK